MSDIKKLILPAAGLGTRFLPMSKAIGKEFLPLADVPLISWAVQEAKASGIEEIIFVVNENNKNLPDYFKSNARLEKILQERGSQSLLDDLKIIHQAVEGISFSTVLQALPRGDGDAVLKAEKKVEKTGFAVAFFDDVFYSKTSALAQLLNIFDTSQKIVVGLKKVSPEKLSSYGVVKVDKIANNLYKIKGIVEKPGISEAPSDLAICGRYVFNEDIVRYLKKTPANKKGEIILAEALKAMIEDGKIIYGCEIEGEWLECGNMADWLKSNLTLCLRHPKYGAGLREMVKKIK